MKHFVKRNAYDDLAPITRWAIETFILLIMLKVFDVIDWSFLQIVLRVALFDAGMRIALIAFEILCDLIIAFIDGFENSRRERR